MSLSRQSTALVLTTKNNQTQHYIHQKHKRETVKTALANKTFYTLIWYAFYDLRSGNGVGAILTAAEPTRSFRGMKGPKLTVTGAAPPHTPPSGKIFISEKWNSPSLKVCKISTF